MEFQVGDVVRHKATNLKCVIQSIEDGWIIVTTSKDETRSYKPWELVKDE